MIELIAVLLSLISGIVGLKILGEKTGEYLARTFIKFFKVENEERSVTPTKKLQGLLENLAKSSTEMDELLLELSKMAEERERNVQKIESDLVDLQSKEQELQDRIKTLESVPLPVAEHFIKLTSQSETRSAYRDYILFATGVVVSTVITIILKVIFNI